MTLLAMATAAISVGLLVRPVTRLSGAIHSPRWTPGPRTLLVLSMASVGIATATLDGRTLALALIGGAGVIGVVQQWRRARQARDREHRRAVVVELAEALASELRAGQPVVTSLERCQQVWPAFQPVAAAARLGADVPSALRRLAMLPGAEGFREVASAWQVSERSGAALSGVLLHVAESARARQAAAHLVRAELASAQATGRLVAALPLATLAMSSGVGATPWAFLLGQPLGLACLGSGVALVFAGLWWIDRIAAAVTRP